MTEEIEKAADDELGEVECILDRKVVDEEVQYEVKWVGTDETSWVPEAALEDCEELIEKWQASVAAPGGDSEGVRTVTPSPLEWDTVAPNENLLGGSEMEVVDAETVTGKRSSSEDIAMPTRRKRIRLFDSEDEGDDVGVVQVATGEANPSEGIADQEPVVVAILEKRSDDVGRVEYNVRYNDGHEAWVPMMSLNCVELIERFEEENISMATVEPSIEMDGGSSQKVAVVDRRVDKNGRTEYCMRYSDGTQSWRPMMELSEYTDLIDEFEQSQEIAQPSRREKSMILPQDPIVIEDDEDPGLGRRRLRSRAQNQEEKIASDKGKSPAADASESTAMVIDDDSVWEGSELSSLESDGSVGSGSEKRVHRRPSERTRSSTRRRNSNGGFRPVKIVTHFPVCYKCNGGAGKRKRADADLMGDTGEMLQCDNCAISWHENCYTAPRKRKSLGAIDTADGDTEHGKRLCPLCVKQSPICGICNKASSRQDGVEDPEEILFRCFRCSYTAHVACLVEYYAERKDQYGGDPSQGSEKWFRKAWKCPDCILWDADVEAILTYREASGDLEGNVLPVPRRPPQACDTSASPANTPKETPTAGREFYVKFKEYCYRQCQWVSERWLTGLDSEKAKWRNFWAMVETENKEARKNGVDIPWPKSVDEVVPVEMVTVERILDAAYVNEKGGDNSLANVEHVLVKWLGQSIAESTWEDVPDEEDDLYESVVDKYNEFLRRRDITGKPRSKRKFAELKEQPSHVVNGELKPYQHDWGCSPFLIVAPSSTLEHWLREFNKWAPDIAVVIYHGDAKERRMIRDHEIFKDKIRAGKKAKDIRCHVIVTSYELIMRESQLFGSIAFELLVCDEGHRLKNDAAKTFNAFRKHISAEEKIILTGTPLQNNIRELFNLMSFLDPTKFKDQREWEEKYSELNDELVQELHQELSPYFLRRTKGQVLLDLPPKIEILVPVAMAPLQKELYKAVLAKNAQLLKAIGVTTSGKEEARVSTMQNILMELRKICNHPFILPDIEPVGLSTDEAHEQLVSSCGKLHLLRKMLGKLNAAGHRVLLFSQFKLALNIIEDFLDGEGIKSLRMDGETPIEQRQTIIDRFNAPNSPYLVFLLTTRTGGTGLNLTSADTIIMYDADWNPHQDLQAMARAHRIGQMRAVVVYKLFTRGCVEEKIIEVGKRKLMLDHLIVEQMGSSSLDTVEIMNIIKFGAKALFEDEAKNQIVYDDAAVDKLINRSEMVAQTVAEKEAASGDGVDGEKAGAFSFAKVWNAETSIEEDVGDVGLGEETEVPDESEDNSLWERIASTKAALLAAETELDANGRPKRRRKQVNYSEKQVRKPAPGSIQEKDVDEEPMAEDPEDEEFIMVESDHASEGEDDAASVIDVDDLELNSKLSKKGPRRSLTGPTVATSTPGRGGGKSKAPRAPQVPGMGEFRNMLPSAPNAPQQFAFTTAGPFFSTSNAHQGPAFGTAMYQHSGASPAPFIWHGVGQFPVPAPLDAIPNAPSRFVPGSAQTPQHAKTPQHASTPPNANLLSSPNSRAPSPYPGSDTYEARWKQRRHRFCCWLCLESLHPLESCPKRYDRPYLGNVKSSLRARHDDLAHQPERNAALLAEVRVQHKIVRLLSKQAGKSSQRRAAGVPAVNRQIPVAASSPNPASRDQWSHRSSIIARTYRRGYDAPLRHPGANHSGPVSGAQNLQQVVSYLQNAQMVYPAVNGVEQTFWHTNMAQAPSASTAQYHSGAANFSFTNSASAPIYAANTSSSATTSLAGTPFFSATTPNGMQAIPSALRTDVSHAGPMWGASSNSDPYNLNSSAMPVLQSASPAATNIYPSSSTAMPTQHMRPTPSTLASTRLPTSHGLGLASSMMTQSIPSTTQQQGMSAQQPPVSAPSPKATPSTVVSTQQLPQQQGMSAQQPPVSAPSPKATPSTVVSTQQPPSTKPQVSGPLNTITMPISSAVTSTQQVRSTPANVSNVVGVQQVVGPSVPADVMTTCYFCHAKTHNLFQYFICPAMKSNPADFKRKVGELLQAGKISQLKATEMNDRATLYMNAGLGPAGSWDRGAASNGKRAGSSATNRSTSSLGGALGDADVIDLTTTD
ncbi:hypothetical protein HK104_002560 [Borealophlyctis nickersoniae]|nr:hypothetical protein HK104_002560 [Borealophlyctis nickersoniae]